jgi:DNA-directed RNA polymerase III subunit RPC1
MLDPACLEGDATPVEYVRSWSHARVSRVCVRRWLIQKTAIINKAARGNNRPLYPYEVLRLAETIYPEIAEGRVKPEPEPAEPVKPAKGKKAKAAAEAAAKSKPAAAAPPPLRSGWEGCHIKYRENTYLFIRDKIVGAMIAQRLRHGLIAGDSEEDAMQYQTELDPEEGESATFRMARSASS